MADFQTLIDDLDAIETSVLAGSIDPPEEAQKTIDRHALTFPVACTMDGAGFGRATGAYWEPEKGYLHATGFIVRPDGTLASATYSTGPVGRYVATDLIGMIKYWQTH